MRTALQTLLATNLALAVCAPAAGDCQQDCYPMGALAFFDLPTCPTDWLPATDFNGNPLNGYFLVPFYSPPLGALGTTTGTAMSNLEVRQHTHGFASSINVAEAKYAGTKGPWSNDDLTSDGTANFSGTTTAIALGVPYVQLLLCQATTSQGGDNPPQGVPQYVVTFFTSTDCPTGWKSTTTTAGRFLVGLPDGGTPAATFGGNPLTIVTTAGNTYQGEDRVHSHNFSGTVHLVETGEALVSGCCDENFAYKGDYNFSGTTAPTPAGLPYMIVTQCQPCLPDDQDPSCVGTISQPPGPSNRMENPQ